MIEDILAGNRRFVENEFSRNQPYYRSIQAGQKPQILWIGCSDSRVSEDIITDSKPGSIFVHRNIANIVSFNDVNIAAIIEYAVNHLKIPDIVVCGHYNCGGIQALAEGINDNYIADWLLISSGAKEKADAVAAKKKLTRKEKLNLLTEENVKLQIKHLQNLSPVKNSQKSSGLPRLHGWIYSLESGKIKVVVDGMKD